LDEAGTLGDAGFDDEDIAVVTTEVIYDLAIAKRVTNSGPYKVGDVVPYEVTVTNQGNVPSGIYSFNDTLPPGMSFVSASDGGTASGQVVSWSDQPSLDPGETHAVTVSAQIVDGSYGEYRNWVQITDDSAGTYSTPTETITDVDSVTDDGERGEDDDANAVITVEPVTLNGTTGSLPVTGGDFVRLATLGALLLAAGAALMLVARRRRTEPG
jgi:uncharacterized repeat protein (TIGR01451 family)/LPXTG-motif cell wall-anchored protein